MADIKKIISQMTLEEKAGLCSGADFWHTKGVERLSVPSVMVSDGPHGLRKQDLEADHLGINESIKAVCFPAGCGTAASFNPELLKEMGEALGRECQAEGVGVILGPAANIKRSPLCGRNFEYYSEDPHLAGVMARAFIEGVQSQNVGTSLKHFLANNQETRRMSSSSEIDERTLREIYLAAFEGAVKGGKPWTVMCSYNKINGTYAAENKLCLTDILRDEWGFDGYVVSDWGAVNKRVEDLAAGLDLEMPSSGGAGDRLIVEAVKGGQLEESVLDTAVERILRQVFRFTEQRSQNAVFDRDADHKKAERIAEETVVLLKNQDSILPLEKGASIAFIGKYAAAPRYQGGGSSHINSHKVTSAMEAAADIPNITYAQGFRDDVDQADEALLAEAVSAAGKADVAVIFAGLPDAFESEGFDRSHMSLPGCQNSLIEAVTAVQPNTVVVLHNGSPVEMPWIGRVKGVLEAYLGGQAIGSAVVGILFGDVNPSGKLPETFPVKLEDNPSYLYFPGEGDRVEYREGVFVGYRYYDTKKMDVLFPFGHGLSYTEFAYSNLRLSGGSGRAEAGSEGETLSIADTDTLTVSVDITNTGARFGREAVQLYVSAPESLVLRPVKELRAFAKVALNPGETKTVTFRLDKRAFSYWETRIHDWYAESGSYELLLGSSSRDIRLKGQVRVTASTELPVCFTPDTCLEDVLRNPKTAEIIKPYLDLPGFAITDDATRASEAITRDMQLAMVRYMPLRGVISFTAGKLTYQDIENLVADLNNALRSI